MTDRIDFRHPPDRRSEGLAAVRKHRSLRKAADATGIPKSTLHDWLRQEAGEPGADAPANPVDTLDVDQDPQASAALDEAEDELADEELAESTTPEEPGTTPPPRLLAHLTDPLYLRAFRRYVSGIANGAHPLYAVQTARAVHPDFDISEEDNARVVNALGDLARGGQLQMSEPLEALLFAAQHPPAYVRRVYDDFSMDDAAVGRLTDLLLSMRTEAYRVGINAQLTAMGRQPVATVTEPATLASLREETATTARQIAETWNRDAASAVGARWLEVAPGSRIRGQAVLTPAEREAYVREAMTEWRDGRRDWKALMWADHQASLAFSRGGRDFVSRNAGAVQTGHVEPYGAECQGCTDLVQLGEQPAEVMMLADLPLHVRCEHYVVWSYSAWNDADGQLWAGQDDGESSGAGDDFEAA
jgi:hypothetical protein